MSKNYENRIYFLHILFFASITKLLGQEEKTLYQQVIGNDVVRITEYVKDTSPIVFISVHDDEEEGVSAVKELYKEGKLAGSLIEIRTIYKDNPNKSTRSVTLRHQASKKTIEFDPNRIYTEDISLIRKGIKTKLTEDSTITSVIYPFKDTILNRLRKAKMVVAIHNNHSNTIKTIISKKDTLIIKESQTYNLLWYLNGAKENNSAERIYLNPKHKNSEFFVVNQNFCFERIAKENYNVILQRKKPIKDGSLSVYYADKKEYYINIEARRGNNNDDTKKQIELQKTMILLIYDLFKDELRRI